MDDISFASLLTPPGMVLAAGLVTGIVQVIKAGLPVILTRIYPVTIAFFLTAVLYLITAVVLSPQAPDFYLGVVFAWVGCATSALGIHKVGEKSAETLGIIPKRPPRRLVGRSDPFDEQ